MGNNEMFKNIYSKLYIFIRPLKFNDFPITADSFHTSSMALNNASGLSLRFVLLCQFVERGSLPLSVFSASL